MGCGYAHGAGSGKSGVILRKGKAFFEIRTIIGTNPVVVQSEKSWEYVG